MAKSSQIQKPMTSFLLKTHWTKIQTIQNASLHKASAQKNFHTETCLLPVILHNKLIVRISQPLIKKINQIYHLCEISTSLSFLHTSDGYAAKSSNGTDFVLSAHPLDIHNKSFPGKQGPSGSIVVHLV